MESSVDSQLPLMMHTKKAKTKLQANKHWAQVIIIIIRIWFKSSAPVLGS